MSINKNKCSVCVVKNKRGFIVGYLSNSDIENGLDVQMDFQGYTVISL